MTTKGYCILFYNRCLCKNKQDFFSSKAVESTFLKRHFIQWVQYFFFIPPFLPVSKIRHIGPLYFHLFIHLNNSWSLQKSFQAKSFSIKDWVLSSFFHIDRKVHLLEKSVYEMSLISTWNRHSLYSKWAVLQMSSRWIVEKWDKETEKKERKHLRWRNLQELWECGSKLCYVWNRFLICVCFKFCRDLSLWYSK